MLPWVLPFLLLGIHFDPAVLTIPIVEAAPDPHVVWMDELADCESGASTTIKVLDTNNYYSYGKYQFQMATWLGNKSLGATKENIYDGALQDTIARHMLDTKGWTHDWVICGARTEKKLGAYPR